MAGTVHEFSVADVEHTKNCHLIDNCNGLVPLLVVVIFMSKFDQFVLKPK